MSTSDQDACFVGDDDSEYFRVIFNRKLNALSSVYLLPCDDEEIKRYELHHRMMQFLFNGNYIGPVKEVLNRVGHHRRVLDLGTGAGHWAIDVADEFPRAEVIGVDLAPIQPRNVPPNCTFELCDIDQGLCDYPDDHFDLIHARSIHTGIRKYSKLIREIYRLLAPGGIVILIEPDLTPLADGKSPSHILDSTALGISNWFALWETYKSCLNKAGIDITVPQRMSDMLAMRDFENVFKREANVPVGFWPTDPEHLTVGQLNWMAYDILLPGLRPFFLSSGLSPAKVDKLIADAQNDLYHPSVNLSTRIHIVHAQKPLHAM